MEQTLTIEEELARFSISMSRSLLRDLDTMVREKGYANRSAALAEIVRAALVEHHQENCPPYREIVGTITLIYDHHKPNLQSLLTELQHNHVDVIISTLHVHLDHDHCLEVLMVRGSAAEVRALADALTTARGVKHGRLTVTTTEKDLLTTSSISNPLPPQPAEPARKESHESSHQSDAD